MEADDGTSFFLSWFEDSGTPGKYNLWATTTDPQAAEPTAGATARVVQFLTP
jgi:hypothetical protein